MFYPQILGFLGGIISAVAYLPQINHLIVEKCTAGISLKAFTLWSIASLLILISAIAIDATVFIFLSTIQLVASLIIIFFTQKNSGQYCPSHLPVKD